MGIPLVPIEKAIKIHQYVEECKAKKQADSSGNFFQAIRGIEDALKTNIAFQRKILKETEKFRGRKLKDEVNESATNHEKNMGWKDNLCNFENVVESSIHQANDNGF